MSFDDPGGVLRVTGGPLDRFAKSRSSASSVNCAIEGVVVVVVRLVLEDRLIEGSDTCKN